MPVMVLNKKLFILLIFSVILCGSLRLVRLEPVLAVFAGFRTENSLYIVSHDNFLVNQLSGKSLKSGPIVKKDFLRT